MTDIKPETTTADRLVERISEHFAQPVDIYMGDASSLELGRVLRLQETMIRLVREECKQ